MEKTFSLKDQLFNQEKVSYLAGLIKAVHPQFQDQAFQNEVLSKFPELELKQRISWMRECLEKFLPKDYKKAVTILLNALPKPCDPNKSDNDFGEFILVPFSDFVAMNGCQKEQLKFSLNALKEITKRFSAEDAIRFFLNAFPKETLEEIQNWTKDPHYHVRRLTSEGTRPRLPWSQKLNLDNTEVIAKILSELYFDPTRFVVRSVANHLNDISKEDPNLVIKTLKKWEESSKAKSKEMEYLKSHALRTLIKAGNQNALEFLGYHAAPKINVSPLKIKTPKVEIGSALEFAFDIDLQKDEKLMIDYLLYFQNKSGKLAPKTFKIKKGEFKKGETITVQKKHPLKKMTTKKLYPGLHKVALQINGQIFKAEEFVLK